VANTGDSVQSTVPPAEPQVTSGAVEEKTQPGGDSTSPEPPPQNTKSREERPDVVSPPPLAKTEGKVSPPKTSIATKPLPSHSVNPSSRGGTTIQVGSFKDQGEADAKAASLNSVTNGEFHVVRAEIPGRGVWYRVQQVEGFATREAAVNYGNRLRARNLISDFIITTR
jgi:cell division protein FtsN